MSVATFVRSHKKLSWGLGGVVIVLAGLYLAGFFLTGSRLPANATIGGIDVGGMSPAKAERTVADAVQAREDAKFSLQYEADGETETVEVSPADVGLEVDAAESVDQAGGERTWNPVRMADLVLGSDEHDLVVTSDPTKMASALDKVAEAVEVEVVQPLITFPKATPRPRSPEDGVAVDRDATARAVEAVYGTTDEPVVDVETNVVEPDVDEAGLQQALTEIAQPAVSAPVTIAVGQKKVALPVSAYAPALKIEPVDGTMTAVIDPEKLSGALAAETSGVGRKAVDARIVVDSGKPRIVPSKTGIGLQPQEMATKIVPVLTESGAARTVTVEAKVVEPEFTTADAEKLGVKEKVSEFTTYFPHAEYRNINQGRAAELLDDTLVMPGETFSFNDTVGERTVENGFTTGSVINGGQFREEPGGGVSQVVTTTYNAAFFAGLEDVHHKAHTFYIDRYPVGREATVYWGSLDMKFKNNTDHGVLINAWVDKSTPGRKGEMHVQMFSTKVWDEVEAGKSGRYNFRTPGKRYDTSDKCVPQSPITGFDIDIYRYFVQDGQRKKSEKYTTTYQAADHVICGEDPAKKKAEQRKKRAERRAAEDASNAG
jgi:vancomycin resistance protein YoaR